MLAMSTPFQSVCSPPTRGAPPVRRTRSERLPLRRMATAFCGRGTTRPCASAWLRPRTRSSGPPRTRPFSSRKSWSGRGAAITQPLTSPRSTGARAMPCRSASHPGAVPAWNCSPGWSCQTLTRVSPQKSSTSAHSPPSPVVTGGSGLPGSGVGARVRTATAAESRGATGVGGSGGGGATGGGGGSSGWEGVSSSLSPWSLAAPMGDSSSGRTTCSAGECRWVGSMKGSSSPWMSCSRGRVLSWVGCAVRPCSSTMMRSSPMEIRSPWRSGAAMMGWPLRKSGRRAGGAQHCPLRSRLDDGVARRDGGRLEQQVGRGAAQADALGAEGARGLELAAIVDLEDDRNHCVSGWVSGRAGARRGRDRRRSGARAGGWARRPCAAPAPARRRGG